ncbi:hypothetical protein TNCV_2201451 [Trichonephila clavipes]|uniref:Uncharacterized protein n=1 Tax=Trichonephila clavipes TaxID=2585209 RepID=A0A8X6SL36_TRICX|nr:hypothetical protein TNCV_2201451 [Trichonephila clavipes]
MATGPYMTPIYSRSQSEVQGDLHNLTNNTDSREGTTRYGTTRDAVSSDKIEGFYILLQYHTPIMSFLKMMMQKIE